MTYHCSFGKTETHLVKQKLTYFTCMKDVFQGSVSQVLLAVTLRIISLSQLTTSWALKSTVYYEMYKIELQTTLKYTLSLKRNIQVEVKNPYQSTCTGKLFV